jgi:DNA-binding transcriptional MerR regulator
MMYSVTEAADLLGLPPARLRYWSQTGLVGPSHRERGRFLYTFADLVAVKVARDLTDAGVPIQRVRKNLDALRRLLPGRPVASLRIVVDGDDLLVLDDDRAFAPTTGQLVLSFALPGQAEVVPLRDSLPETAYGCFVAGVAAEDEGDDARATQLYEAGLRLDPCFAAAWTNLGNLRERAGQRGEARAAYERAFNLANLHADLGENELALAEYRRVVGQDPGFADVHFNLGLLFARIGAASQARSHLGRYLETDADSPWADAARRVVSML